ncbi:MAG: efflux RND transporter periplasmic adaptor subunit [Butyrivibrio sp.]|nr:efflux RND transporter periplasmic adaptor subunit [Butyrivibrio sp.]
MAQDNEIKNNTEETQVKEAEKTSAELNTESPAPAAPVYEDYEVNEIAGKPKKRFKKRFLVLGAAVLVVGGIIVSRFMNSGKNLVYVTTQEASLGTIENILSISGTVQSAESKSYFAGTNAKIAEIPVKAGDKVSAGDILCTYDEEALDLARQTAELSIKQAKGSYSANFTGSAAADREYAKGMNAQQINERLDAITAQIDALNTQITEKRARMNQTLTDLQKVQADINQNGIADSSEGLFEKNGSDSYLYRNESGNKEEEKYTEPTPEDRQMSLAIQQSIADVQYALSNDPETQGWNDQITALNEEKAHLQSAKASLLNSGQIAAAKAQLDSTELSSEDTIAKIDEAKEGVKADFNGVVSSVKAVEGQSVQTGTLLFTLDNLDDVEVAIQVSKSDLPKIAIGQQVDVTINGNPYNGEITKISGTASKNNNGVAVVDTTIKIKNPDSNIILGVEANNKIHAQKADNTLVLPYEYIKTDSEGDHVYVVENGLVVRKNVTLGITSSTEAQVIEGLSAGEAIITSDTDSLIEGTAVLVQQQ